LNARFWLLAARRGIPASQTERPAMIPEELDPFDLLGHDPHDALPTPLDAYLLMELSNNLGDESDEDDEVE